ncbi:MAG: hypothetical protein D3915_15260 [Candidatus Electrothrix sp. AU1_5]|nr:hypothetical protein [Candidatus Electrothrix gigas]
MLGKKHSLSQKKHRGCSWYGIGNGFLKGKGEGLCFVGGGRRFSQLINFLDNYLLLFNTLAIMKGDLSAEVTVFQRVNN